MIQQHCSIRHWCAAVLHGCLLAYSSAQAQSDAELQYKYLNARSYMEAGHFNQAQPLLARINRAQVQPYSRYARLYEGICLFYMGNPLEAMQTLESVAAAYPGSDIASEAFVFQFHSALSASLCSKALSIYINLPEEEQRTYAGTLFKALDSTLTDSIIAWQKTYSHHQGLAEYTLRRLHYVGVRNHTTYAQQLARQHGLDVSRFPRSPSAVRESKKVKDIALLIPLSEPLTDTLRKQLSGGYLYDYYSGFMWAMDSLQQRTGKLRVHTFLTGRHADTLRALFDLPAMAQMNLIVGPVLTPLANSTADFAQKHRILHFNPLNDLPSVAAGRSFTFCPEPQSATVGQAVQQYVLLETLARSTFVIGGDSDKDTLLAGLYERQALVDSSLKMLLRYKFGRSSSEALFTSLSAYTMDSLSHFYAPISDPTAQAAMMSVLDRIPNMVEVYTGSDWLQNALISFSQFEQRHFRFYFPDYIQYDHPVAQSFRQFYINRTGVVPSLYAYKGVEHALQLSRVLLNQEEDAHVLMQDRFLPGIIMQGMDFRSSRQNGFVPLFKFDKEQLIRINQPKRD